MFDQLVSYLNNVKAGDAVLFGAVVCWAITQIYKKVKEVLDKHKDRVVEDIQHDEEMDKLIDDLKEAKAELDNLKSSISTQLEETTKKLDEYIRSSSEERENLMSGFKDISSSFNQFNKDINNLEKRIVKIEKQIDLLFRGDKESMKSFFIDAYNKYVEQDKKIDLYSLQRIENVYSQFVAECTGEVDEFVVKLMSEIRNLPTTKDN